MVTKGRIRNKTPTRQDTVFKTLSTCCFQVNSLSIRSPSNFKELTHSIDELQNFQLRTGFFNNKRFCLLQINNNNNNNNNFICSHI